eukprot:4467765-Alexandrium_andersonii.AAC.1
MVQDCGYYGCASRCATWTDESLNRCVKAVARNCYSLHFEKRVLERTAAVLAAGSGNKRKR